MTDPFATATQLPSNLEAERALLGSMLLDSRRIDGVLERMPGNAIRKNRESVFFSAAHQMIFDAIVHLHGKGMGADLTTLADLLRARGQLELVGGTPYVAGLEDDVFALSQASQYADIVVQKWRLRCLIHASQATIDDALRGDVEAAEAIDRAETRVFELSQSGATSDFVQVRDDLPTALARIEARAAAGAAGRPLDLPGVAVGLPTLDRMTNGFRPGQLVILAARPSVGKSALALNFAAHVAMRLGLPVGFFSLEMTREEIRGRLIATESMVPQNNFSSGRGAEPWELDKIHEAAGRIDYAPFFIDESSSITLNDFRARARRLAARHPKLALIVVDYLQLVSYSKRAENNNLAVGEVTKGLKILAKELGVTVLALSQMSRDVEKRTGKLARPRLSDLRDSGSIEQDADIVIFIHRMGEIASASRWVKDKPPEECELIISKHRNGACGIIDVLFRGCIFSFIEKTG